MSAPAAEPPADRPSSPIGAAAILDSTADHRLPVAWRGELSWLAAIFGVGLILRVAHVLTTRHGPFLQHLFLDPLEYDQWARSILAGPYIGDGLWFQDPLYAYLLAAIYAVLGDSPVTVALVQGFLGALVGPLLIVATRPWFDARIARLTGALAAVYLPSIHFEAMVMKTGPGLLAATVALTLASVALARDWRRQGWIGVGACLGVTVLLRGNVLAVLPVLIAWLAWRTWPVIVTGRKHRRGEAPERRDWRPAAMLACGVAVVLLPVMLRNRAVVGEWILTTANTGQNFYIGNNPVNRSGQYDRLPFVDPNPKHEQRGFEQEAERRTGRDLTAKEVSSYWWSAALDWMTDHPGAAAALTVRKARNYLGAYEAPDNLDYYEVRRRSPVLRLPLASYGVILPFALLGAGLNRHRRGWPRLLILYAATYGATVVLFFVFARFRVAMMPAAFALAAFAIIWLLDRARAFAARRTGGRGLTIACAVLAVAFAVVHLPIRAVDGSLAARTAHALHLPRVHETTATARLNLGLALAARASDADAPGPLLEQARVELQAACEIDPTHEVHWTELGKVLARQRRHDEARAAYAEALRISPGNWRLHHSVGLLFKRDEAWVAAADAFQQALEANPRSYISAVELGEAQLAAGRPEPARTAFERALALRPDDARARRGLDAATGTAPMRSARP